MSEAFVTFREALEAALVVGILARYAPRQERAWLWIGLGTAICISGAAAVVLARLSTIHQLWEVLFSGSAAGMLLYMIVWMQRRGATLSADLKEAAQSSVGWLLFGLSFSTTLREGLETALFLRTLWAMQRDLSWIGGLLGVLSAAIIGVAIFLYGKRIPLRPFFRITSILLLFMAAGMAAYAVHELLEYLEARYSWAEDMAEAKAWQVFTPQSSPPEAQSWAYTFSEGQYYPPLHHKGWVGAILHAFTGWRAEATWAELITWLLTLSTGLYFWQRYPSPAKPK
ncbi:MAG: FTR1 family protein [Bacteroidia bacterium]|nr:FTR1 family protein [Bacteroidia bacterium]